MLADNRNLLLLFADLCTCGRKERCKCARHSSGGCIVDALHTQPKPKRPPGTSAADRWAVSRLVARLHNQGRRRLEWGSHYQTGLSGARQ